MRVDSLMSKTKQLLGALRASVVRISCFSEYFALLRHL